MGNEWIGMNFGSSGVTAPGVLVRSLQCMLTAAMLLAQQVAAESAGERIAKKGVAQSGAVACASCHGADGGGNEQSGFPRLAGLDTAYIENQLHAFRKGQRKNPVMAGMAAPLTQQDIKDVAAYYAGLAPVSHASAPAEVAVDVGEQLVNYGDMTDRGLPACNQCHAPGGLGVGASFPPLAGQPYSYLLAQIKAWQSGTRSGDPLGLMKAVSGKLTDAEAESVAAYLAGLPLAAENAQVGHQADAGAVAGTVQKSATHARTASATVPAHQGETEPGRKAGNDGYFRPPSRAAYPDGEMGDMIRLGEAVFAATDSRPESAHYVGNRQVCAGCHLDAGRLANSAPLWAAWVAYPAYRKKNDKVNTFIERVQGCFTYSMNAQGSAAGHAPAADSEVMLSLVSYAYWLASGAPTGDRHMAGRGFTQLAEPPQGFDPGRGAGVYKEKCALCHGDDGQGRFAQGRLIFPPLWGAGSYNWGAGMHRVNTAAAFIKLNMPFGLADPVRGKAVLSDQEAWDVGAYMNAQERPQDPRFTGDLAETRKKFHDSKYDYYGKREKPDGRLLGDNAAAR